jgi:hypothetical protein
VVFLLALTACGKARARVEVIERRTETGTLPFADHATCELLGRHIVDLEAGAPPQSFLLANGSTFELALIEAHGDACRVDAQIVAKGAKERLETTLGAVDPFLWSQRMGGGTLVIGLRVVR